MPNSRLITCTRHGRQVTMPSGGARARSGPTRDPNALRRNRRDDKSGVLTLPAEGYRGPLPRWPYADGSAKEKKRWRELWRTPQAHAWHRLAIDLVDVAEYIRMTLELERGAPWVKPNEVRQRRSGLGLNPEGMRANGWAVGDREPVKETPTKQAERASSRSRLKVVTGGEG